MRSLPACWPQADRDTWQQACRPHVRLPRRRRRRDEAGHPGGSHRRYGYFLDHLGRGVLDLAAPAGAQVTPAAVESFREVRSIWRSVTQAQSTYKLRRMAEILAPERTSPGCGRSRRILRSWPVPRPLRPDRDDRGAGRGRARSIRRLSLPFIDGAGGEPRSCATVHDRASGSPSDSVQELCRAELIEELCRQGDRWCIISVPRRPRAVGLTCAGSIAI